MAHPPAADIGECGKQGGAKRELLVVSGRHPFVGAALALVTAHYYVALIVAVLATPACKKAIDKARTS
jgi:hypothetical protein